MTNFTKKLFLFFIVLFFSFSCKKFERKEITLWTYNHEMKEVIDIYNSQHRHNINYKFINFFDLRTSFMHSVQNMSGPDIIIGVNDWLGEFAIKEMIRPLDDFIDIKKFKKKYPKIIIDTVTFDNKIYGIPFFVETTIIFYNKDIIPELPDSIEEIIELTEKLKKKNKFKYNMINGTMDPYFTIPFIHGFNGQVFDKDINPGLNSPGSIEAIKYLSSLCKNGKIPRESRNNSILTMFFNKRTPVLITGSWNLQSILQYAKNTNFKLGIKTLPKIKKTGANLKPFLGVKPLIISKNCKEIEAAMDLINFLSENNTQKLIFNKYKFIPANIKIIKFKDNSVLSILSDQIDKSIAMPNNPEMMFYWSSLNGVLNNAFNDPSATEELLNKEQEYLSEITKLYQKKYGTKKELNKKNN